MSGPRRAMPLISVADDTKRGVLTVEECEGVDRFDVIDPSHDSRDLAKARIAAI